MCKLKQATSKWIVLVNSVCGSERQRVHPGKDWEGKLESRSTGLGAGQDGYRNGLMFSPSGEQLGCRPGFMGLQSGEVGGLT